MSNTCEIEEVEQIQPKVGQPTLMEMWTKLNRLELENSCLKADKQELLIENEQLRNDNLILHNKFDIKEDLIRLEISYQSDTNNLEEDTQDEKPLYSDEGWDGLSNGYENISTRRFGY
jgi:uncharacterized protein YicC (UPF0701 family)